MKQVEIDGAAISNLDELFDEIQKKLCPDFKGFGRNYNAVIDVLMGGFGVHEYEEPIKLIWNDSINTQKMLGNDFTDLIGYIREMEHIQLELR